MGMLPNTAAAIAYLTAGGATLTENGACLAPRGAVRRPAEAGSHGTAHVTKAGLTVTIPIRTVNILNVREHHMDRHKRSKAEHAAVRQATDNVSPTTWEALAVKCVVRLVRIAPRKLGNEEALMASLKSVRDQLAQLLWGGTIGQRDDDGGCGVWKYSQVKSERQRYAVLCEIRRTT